MTPIPPAALMGGPPVQPPTVPTVSAIPQADNSQGLVAALPKLVFNIEQQLNTLARVLPQESEKLNEIRDSLRDVLSSALQRGAGAAEPSPTRLSREGMETAIP